MSNTIRIKRRANGGGAGAPASLANAELAFNEETNVLYYGTGTGGTGGTATQVIAIGGDGVFATKTYVGTELGSYLTTASASSTYLSQSSAASTYLTISNASSTYLTQSNAASTYLTISDASSTYLAQSDAASTYLTISSASSTYLTQSSASSTYLSIANASSTYAPLASPALSGTPTAPTAAALTNSTQIATTAYVDSAVSSLVDAAPAALNTLNELAAALGDDANFATTISTSLGEKLVKSANLSDLTDVSAARTNLGLAIGTNVQAYDAELAALAGLTSASDKVPYFTGAGTAAVADFTTFGRSLVDDADAAAARSTLGLGTISTQASDNVNITGGTISGASIDCGTF